jgi:hypothetical protein
MPEARARLDVDLRLGERELEMVRRGHAPGGTGTARAWSIECEGDRVFLRRARTGHCIFEVELEPCEGGAWTAAAWTNREPSQAGRIDGEADARLLVFLVERLLLGRNTPYPGAAPAPLGREP